MRENQGPGTHRD